MDKFNFPKLKFNHRNNQFNSTIMEINIPDLTRYSSDLFDKEWNHLLEPQFNYDFIHPFDQMDMPPLPMPIHNPYIKQPTHTTRKRAKKCKVPDSEKDEKYWKYRIQNTLRARESRAAARLRKLSNTPAPVFKNKGPRGSIHNKCKFVLARLTDLKFKNDMLIQEINILQKTKSDLVQKIKKQIVL